MCGRVSLPVVGCDAEVEVLLGGVGVLLAYVGVASSLALLVGVESSMQGICMRKSSLSALLGGGG